jgi:hypothetical protein
VIIYDDLGAQVGERRPPLVDKPWRCRSPTRPCWLAALLCRAVQEALKLAPPHAELLYVGKRGGKESTPQKSIDALLVDRAAQVGLRLGTRSPPVQSTTAAAPTISPLGCCRAAVWYA